MAITMSISREDFSYVKVILTTCCLRHIETMSTNAIYAGRCWDAGRVTGDSRGSICVCKGMVNWGAVQSHMESLLIWTIECGYILAWLAISVRGGQAN